MAPINFFQDFILQNKVNVSLQDFSEFLNIKHSYIVIILYIDNYFSSSLSSLFFKAS